VPDTAPYRPPDSTRIDLLSPADTSPPQLQPLLVDIIGLSKLLCRSVPALERDQVAGRIPRPLRIGRSKRWRLQEIMQWIEIGCPDRKTWEARRRK